MAFLQVLFYLGFSSVFSHLWLYRHFHVDFRVYLHLNFIIMFDYFCSCKYNLSPDLALDFFLIGKWGSYTPELFSLLENVSHIHEISWGNDQDLIVGKVNNLCVIIGGFDLFVVLIDVGIEAFLEFKIVQEGLVGFVVGIGELEEVNEAVGFSDFGLPAINFEWEWFRWHLKQMLLVDMEQGWKHLQFRIQNIEVGMGLWNYVCVIIVYHRLLYYSCRYETCCLTLLFMRL